MAPLVQEYPVPPSLLGRLKQQVDYEFIRLRYTAATCDPSDFAGRHTLRQAARSGNRQTEVFIAITLYNEEVELLARTIDGVIKNIPHLCKEDVLGPDGWKKIVVCVIADGREKFDPKLSRLIVEPTNAHWRCWVLWACIRRLSEGTLLRNRLKERETRHSTHLRIHNANQLRS
jgi:hypothetical protein